MVDRVHGLCCGGTGRTAPSRRRAHLLAAARGTFGQPVAFAVAFAQRVALAVDAGPTYGHADRRPDERDTGTHSDRALTQSYCVPTVPVTTPPLPREP